MSDEPSNAASRFIRSASALLSERESPPAEEWVRAGLTDDFTYEDHRSGPTFPDLDAGSAPKLVTSHWLTGAGRPRWVYETLAVRGERFAAVAMQIDYGNGMLGESIQIIGLDASLSKMQRHVDFDIDDVDSAVAELDRLHREADAS